jgi:hypothetical protein
MKINTTTWPHTLTIKKGERVPFRFLRFRTELVDGSGIATTDIEIVLNADPYVPFYMMGWVGPSLPPANEAVVIPFAIKKSVWPGTYAEYLATPEFRMIAAAARKYWGYRCLLNSNHPGVTEMHHRNYEGVPFHEDWQSLIPLCEECHERHHGRLPKPPRGLFEEPVELKRAA